MKRHTDRIDFIESRLSKLELIDRLESRITAQDKELEALRNLIRAKAEDESKPKRIIARNTRDLRLLINQEESDAA